MPWWGDLLIGAAILLAAIGCILPLLPGGLLALGAVLVWALVEQSATGWAVLAMSVLVISAGQALKYAWPGRRLVQRGVPSVSIIVGGLSGIIGFFVVPLIGLPLGFVAGIFGAELLRVRQPATAWTTTVEALKATGLSILVELASVLIVATIWLGGVVVSS